MAAKNKAVSVGAGAVAAGKAAKDNAYVQRFIEDEDLRQSLQTAFESARSPCGAILTSFGSNWMPAFPTFPLERKRGSPAASRPSPLARQKSLPSILTSNARPPSSLASKRNSFAPTKPPGNFSVRNLLGTKGCALIGSSAQKRKKQNASGFPCS